MNNFQQLILVNGFGQFILMKRLDRFRHFSQSLWTVNEQLILTIQGIDLDNSF